MSAPTVKFVLRKQKEKPDGTVPVWLRVTHARRSRFLSTGVTVEPKQWNARKARVRGGHPLSDSINAKLDDLQLKAQRVALSARSAEAVIASLDGAAGTLTAFFEGFIDALDKRGKYWEWKKYRVTLGKLHAALGSPVAWGALDRNGLARFERYLRDKAENSPNTLRKELSRVHRVVKQAVKEGALRPEANPFVTYDMPKSEPVERRRLTREEIAALVAVDLEPGSRRRVVRDLYLLCFYAAGVRVSDALRFTPDNVRGDRLDYRMLKTGHLQSVKLPPQALELLAPYVEASAARASERRPYPYLFPLMKTGNDADPVSLRKRIQSANVRTNKALKGVAKAAGISPDGFTMHTARHSFADLARQSGDLYAVSKALGHSRLQTTQAYLSDFDRTAVDALTDAMWATSDGHIDTSGDGAN